MTIAPVECGVPRWKKVEGEWGDDYGDVQRGGGEYHAPRTSRGTARILFLHGGVHCYYSAAAYRPLASKLAALTGLDVLVPDFRLAPQFPFPAALDDAAAALAWLRNRAPVDAPVVVVGDSSGGGLAVSLALRDPSRVAAVYACAPWLDLTCGAASYETRKFRRETSLGDPVFNSGDAERERAETLEMARAFLGDGTDPKDPLASPTAT